MNEISTDSRPLDIQETGARTALVLFSVISVLVLGDVAHDAWLGADWHHLAVEAALMLAALAGAAMFYRKWSAERAESRALLVAAERRVATWREEATAFRAEVRDLARGLSEAIDRQLESWQLTAAEKDVALLLLKGLSMKEVAGVRGASERTVRKQAQAVYAKAGLSNRAELSAFFLEDILVIEASLNASLDASLGSV